MIRSHIAEWTDKATETLKNGAFGDCLTIEVRIAGVKTNCLLDTGSEVSTITESFQQELKLSSAHWVKLPAANGLDILVLGCLQADVECMGKVLPGNCIFVLTDTSPEAEEIRGLSGIIGMNIISEFKSLFVTQKQGGAERVIAFASRGLRGSEKNDKYYSAFKLELLSLKWAATEKSKKDLMFSKFTVITDHNPLRYLETLNLGAVEQRWVAQLAELNFEVLYKPGRLNTNADALSRIPSREVPEREDTEKDFIRLNSEEVRTCLWPAQEFKWGKTDVQVAVQASIKKVLNGYSWDEIRAARK